MNLNCFFHPTKVKTEDLPYLYKRQNKEPGLKIYWQLYMPYMKLDTICHLKDIQLRCEGCKLTFQRCEEKISSLKIPCSSQESTELLIIIKR